MGNETTSEALAALALSLRQRGDFRGACEAARKALALDERNAAAWFNLGAAQAGLHDPASAETAYRKAIALRPDYAEAWSNLGGVLSGAGRRSEALAAYQQGIAANDRLAPIWSNLSNALCAAGRHAEAEVAARNALQLDPGFVAAWVNLGRALHAARRFDEARAACERALELSPALPDAWAGLANAWMGQRQSERAIAAFGQAIALQPRNPDYHANLAVALHRTGQEKEARESMRRALALEPDHAFALWTLAGWLIEQGEYAEGWRHYEARWRLPDAPTRRYAPKGGKPERGRALVWAEQGVGDEILYCVLAAELARRGVEVTLEADARLAPLFRRSFPQLSVQPRREPPALDPADFDHVLPLASLGQHLRASREAFIPHRGYLVANASRAAAYRAMLPRERLLVGLAWRSRNPELGAEKSAPLAAWGPILAVAGAAFVNLQYGDVQAECEEAERRFNVRIAHVPQLDLHDDLDGLAALQSACDLVITTSNVCAHVTGALGRPGWVLLPGRIGRIWYWGQEGETTPWYPSLALIAQRRDGDWASAIEPAAQRLHAMLARAP